jgi:uncharacterized protein involved in outer membrane biogenesis
MNNVLITIGVLIVAVLSALFAIPYVVDWNTYRGVIEEEASRMLGRDVRIGGDIKLQVLPSPSFVVNRLRVADTTSTSGEPMFRADQVAARLSVIPLLRGALEANEIELIRPVLRFTIDEQGRGNWRSLGQGTGTLPFVPNDVALQSVRITDGAVSLQDRGGTRERVSLLHVNGQLSAPALEGPYRFRGLYGQDAQIHDLRFTTTPPDATGTVQLKATLKDQTTGASASLDGRLANLGGEPTLRGELSALFPLPGAGKPRPPAAGDTKAGPPALPQAELKSDIAGDARGISLDNLSLAFESAGRPEVLTGQVAFSWANELSTRARLSAPWIDLDPVLGTTDGGSPLLTVAAFAQRINGLATRAGTTDAVLEIEQANLGAELIGGIRIAAKSDSDGLALEEVRASLPGGARLQIQGRIAGQDAATTFDGDMTLRGTSIARLTAWATGGATVIAPIYDQSFQVRGRLAADPGRATVQDVSAEIGDTSLEGMVDYTWSGTRKLRIEIEGPRIDARPLLPARLTLQKLTDWTASRTATTTTTGVTVRPDMAVQIRAGQLVLADNTWRDVTASFSSRPQGITIESLHFNGAHGTAVSLEGHLTSDYAAELTGNIAAADAEGLATLSALLDVPLIDIPSADLLPDVLPLKLAGTFSRAAGTAASTRVVADGRLGGADAKIRTSFDQGFTNWRTSPADIDVVLLASRETALAARAFALLRGSILPVAEAKPRDTPKGPHTRLALRASGVPAAGLATAVRLENPEASVTLEGNARVLDNRILEASGDVRVEARDGRDLMRAWSGIDASSAAPVAVSGTGRFEQAGRKLILNGLALNVAVGAVTSTLSGTLAVDIPPGTPSRQSVTGDVKVSNLDALTLFAPALQQTRGLQQTPPVIEAALAATGPRGSIWPARVFNFTALANTDLTVRMTADRLTMPGAAELSDARFVLLARADVIEVRDLTAGMLKGRLSGATKLDRTQTGAALAATFNLNGARLEAFGGAGPADATLQLSGRGLDPAGLVAALAGTGTLVLGPSAVRELNPELLLAAIETALKATPEKLSATLRAALAADTSRTSVVIGPRSLPITVQDGLARLAPLTISSKAGRMSGQAWIDLSNFIMTADWRVEAMLPPLPSVPTTPPAPPAATVIALPATIQKFQLTPADLDPARPSRRSLTETDALERELAVRKVERDLAELERLRKLDEERAAAQREAQAAAEQSAAQRPGPAPAAPVQ